MSFVEPIGALGCLYALRVLHRTRLRTGDLLLVSTGLGVLPQGSAGFMPVRSEPLSETYGVGLAVLSLRVQDGLRRDDADAEGLDEPVLEDAA